MPVLAQSHLRVFEGVVHAANWLTAKVRPSSTPQHLVTGEQGEVDAFFYLRRQGYVVVARRYRSALRRGDIDLIAWQGDTLCFVEVKTRSSRDFASAESSVDEHKRETLRRLARIYLRSADHGTAYSLRRSWRSIHRKKTRRNSSSSRARSIGTEIWLSAEIQLLRVQVFLVPRHLDRFQPATRSTSRDRPRSLSSSITYCAADR